MTDPSKPNRKNHMTFMSKIRVGTWTAVSAALLLPFAARAEDSGSGLQGSLKSNLKGTGDATGLSNAISLPEMIGEIIKQFLTLLGIVLVVFIMYAGYLWMTAQGNEEQITKAKNIIKNCVIGMIIMMAAYAITSFVVNSVIVGTGLENPGGT